MQRKLQPTVLNPISLLGASMAAFSLVIILVLLSLGATGALANPYTGILTFLIGPGALALGLILIPLGAVRERRRLARIGIVVKTYPTLDLNDPRQRRGVTVFAGVTAGILSLMAVTTWGAAEFMESKEFCGDLCHRVMQPEGAAYTASPHARVKCVSCHIGPGAPWLVKAKLSGLRQVVNYTFDRYPRPIDTPIKDLRPSRDTCEQCHWPERFYGDQERTFNHYGQDQNNTPRSQPLVFRVGGSAQGIGIHWHTTAKVWYLPLNASRSEIGWVGVEKPDGTVDEYVNPALKDQVTPGRVQNEKRFMDCIDCHNRAAHSFPAIEDGVDQAMAAGSISPSIPYIKQQTMKALGDVGQQTTQAEYDATVRRIDAIEDYYRTQDPKSYAGSGAQITRAIAEIKTIYQRTVFPDMNVGPGTYPDWIGHDGCNRCHGTLVGTQGDASGKTIAANCLNCHYPAPSAPQPPASASLGVGSSQLPASPILPAVIPHPTAGRETCTACHPVGGQGIGSPGGTGIPADHKDRTDATCVGCHFAGQPAVSASPPPAAAAAPAAPVPVAAAPAGPPGIPHPTKGQESCTTCHAVGGPGVGAAGGLGLPIDHQGRTDATCVGCHLPK